MDNRDKVLLQELLQESERKYRDVLSIGSIVSSDLESLIAKCARSDKEFSYYGRRLTRAIEQIDWAGRNYLDVILDMQLVLER